MNYVLGTGHADAEFSLLSKSLKSKIQTTRLLYIEDSPARESFDSDFIIRELRADLEIGLRSRRTNKDLFSSTDWLKLRRILIEDSEEPKLFTALSPRWAWYVANKAITNFLSELVSGQMEELAKKHPELLKEMNSAYSLASKLDKENEEAFDWVISKVATDAGVEIRYLDEHYYIDNDLFPELKGMTAANLKAFVRARLKQVNEFEKFSDERVLAHMRDLAAGSAIIKLLEWTQVIRL